MYKVEMEGYDHHCKIINEKDESKRKELEEDARKKLADNERHLVSDAEPQSSQHAERLVDTTSTDADQLLTTKRHC
uniref:Uncharacterized protein n=1 Tax=Panagrellus redivivus TaxID=6233 RepID=A0A7E5A1G4_PANRE